jgi:hypothetical protein
MDLIWLISNRDRVYIFFSLSQSAGGFGETLNDSTPLAAIASCAGKDQLLPHLHLPAVAKDAMEVYMERTKSRERMPPHDSWKFPNPSKQRNRSRA